MGDLSPDSKHFVKNKGYHGLLSTVSENFIRTGGVHRYSIKFTAPEGTEKNAYGLSLADGFGFVFNDRLPCTKNIQRINSVFVNRRGQY